MFWHWILVTKNSGMSPEEICKLKWKNVEIVDVGRVSNTKAQEKLGTAQNIQKTFIDFQVNLYEEIAL